VAFFDAVARRLLHAAAVGARIEWRIVPRHTPLVLRRCPRCDGLRSYVSTDKFRVNAAGRKLDVWLIYRCRVCKHTWNSAILSRVTPESIDPELYQNFLSNDRETAWRYAFDYDLLKKNEVEYDPKIKFDVQGPRVEAGSGEQPIELRITFAHPIFLRLETLLANELGISRSRLEALHESGAIAVASHGKLSRKIKSEVLVKIDARALGDSKVPD
jgi:hypothetical protein